MKKKIIRTLATMLFFISAILLSDSTVAYADTGTVKFGSESYEYEANEEFLIGVYIQGDETIGTYYVEVAYDVNRMEYIGGGESHEDGIITLQGTATESQVRYMLQFKPLSGGDAYIEIKYAKVMTAESDNKEQFEMELNEATSIYLNGEDVAIDAPTPIQTIGGQLQIGGEKYYLLDLSRYELEDLEIEFQSKKGTFDDQKITFLVNNEKNASYVYLVDAKNELHLYGYCEENGNLYSCKKWEEDGKTYYLTNAQVCSSWPAKLTLDTVNRDAVYFGIDEEGNSGFYQIKNGTSLIEWDADLATDMNEKYLEVYKWIAITVGIVLGFMVIIGIGRSIREKKRRRKDDLRIIDFDTDDIEEIGFLDNLEKTDEESVFQESLEEPIISVQNVTMEFKVSTSNASGIKEYFIQLLKKQVTYRKLIALDNVSFDVFKGEVVGIIGTNGSGKSTILRIVSGALKPSSGRVNVDTRKIQLLTLGTGFDMELTARENVYLNGAIIGLSKEFLDEHYQEIVDFAELEGFMEEKVKNFSSGMVSRLGFAIATVGEVSEILILDEVLSVGDEFFRKKSLKKVKEMIHSGSTVLMVSHSAQTIIENCTKAVWIEKGRVKMVGEPRLICSAYRKSQEKK